MRNRQQRTLDSFRRVQDFLDAHTDQVAPLKESAGRKQLDDAVDRIAAQENAQGTANLTMAGQKNREESLAQDLIAQHMRPITVFARARLRGVPDFAALTKPTSTLQLRALVSAARAMASAAAPYAADFEAGGLGNHTIQELLDAATAVESAITERANTKVGRVHATNGIGEEMQRGSEGVGMLHAAITRQFGRDKTFLAAWRSARRITYKPGIPRGDATPQAPVTST